MKITISKRFTSVELYKSLVPVVKNLKTNKAFFEDMQTCITGIEYINGRSIFGMCKNSVELKSLELYGITDQASFTLHVQVYGWCHADEKVRDFIADLSIYGKLTDDGTYFEWDEASPTGAPLKMHAKMYLEA